MSTGQQARHNMIVLGETSPPLAAVFERMQFSSDYMISRNERIEAVNEAVFEWPPTLFSECVAYTWVFFNDQDLESRAVRDILDLSSKISRTMLFSYVGHCRQESDACEGWPALYSTECSYPVFICRYTDEKFRALEIFQSFVQTARARAEKLPEYTGAEAREKDPLYQDARRIVLGMQRPSISLIQRHLRIGYNRASRLLDAMDGDIVSRDPETGSYRMNS